MLKTCYIDKYQNKDRGLVKFSREGVVKPEGYKDRGLLSDKPPILCKEKGCREKKFVPDTSAQHNTLCLHVILSCRNSHKQHKIAQRSDTRGQKRAMTWVGGLSASSSLAAIHVGWLVGGWRWMLVAAGGGRFGVWWPLVAVVRWLLAVYGGCC